MNNKKTESTIDKSSLKVTVVIPVYNVEKFLLDCVNSVIQQSYNNLEIILVDDGSTDNSPEICKDLKLKDNRIKIIHQDNKGLSGARNTGIKAAKGELICFIDSDDIVAPYFIEAMITAMEDTGCDIVQCGITDSLSELNIKQKNEVLLIERRKALNCYFSETIILASACSKLYRREMWESIVFPEGIIYEDYATIYKIINSCSLVGVVSENGYYYRHNTQSITKSPFSINRLKLFEVSSMIKKDIAEEYPECIQHIANRDTRYAISFFREAALAAFKEKNTIQRLVEMIKSNIWDYCIYSNYRLLSKVLGISISLFPNIMYFVLRLS